KTNGAFTANVSAPSILSFDDQTPFLTALRQPAASVYVFTAPINRTNSNFQNSPLIVPTFYNMAQNASKAGVASITIGSNQTYIIDAMLSKDEIVNVKNSGDAQSDKFIPIQQIMNNKVKLEFGDFPELAGNYGIYKQSEHLKNISFNYGRTESNLTDAQMT